MRARVTSSRAHARHAQPRWHDDAARVLLLVAHAKRGARSALSDVPAVSSGLALDLALAHSLDAQVAGAARRGLGFLDLADAPVDPSSLRHRERCQIDGAAPAPIDAAHSSAARRVGIYLAQRAHAAPAAPADALDAAESARLLRELQKQLVADGTRADDALLLAALLDDEALVFDAAVAAGEHAAALLLAHDSASGRLDPRKAAQPAKLDPAGEWVQDR